jgi:hypothetical protein
MKEPPFIRSNKSGSGTNSERLDQDQQYKVSVKDIWINWRSYRKELSYPLSGLFVKELIHRFGREMYLTIFKDQRYENDGLDKLIKEFDGEINNI